MGAETFEFEELKKTYNYFQMPIAEIWVDGESIGDGKSNVGFSDIHVEMTCGYEASIATFMLYDVFDEIASQFQYDAVKNFIQLGSVVVIHMGYDNTVREVFRGFIAKVNFIYETDDMPGIRVTAMDIKGIMMSNSYSKQFKAQSFSGAVKEIFRNEPYNTFFSKEAKDAVKEQAAAGAAPGGIAAAGGGGAKEAKKKATFLVTEATIQDTPDAKQSQGQQQGGGEKSNRQSETTHTIEMVGESDYEFIVKAAKKYNYEFYILGGNLQFRQAKKDTSTLIKLSPATMLQSLDAEYDITGLVNSVEVRNVDPGKGTILTTKKTNTNKIGAKAKSVVKNLQKVFIDPTAESKDETGHRAAYLLEDMVYRFGTLRATIVGLPELVPGKFIVLENLGTTVNNTYYIMNVIHTMRREGEYLTEIIAKAAKV